MKKIVFTFIIFAGGLQAKSQQLQITPLQPSLKNFRILPDSVVTLQPHQKLNIQPKTLQLLADINIDDMPVARMRGRSNMPIVQTDVTGYTMPVAGSRQRGIYYMKKPVLPNGTVSINVPHSSTPPAQ